MDKWKVPGLAVAVVQNGEVAFLRASGLRDVETGLTVTTDTQFQIASVTKSFTATGLALLVDEGRMDWKKPVREYIPESGCMMPSRPTASRCAICSVIIPGCRVTIGYGCPAICHPCKCWRQCAIWSRATTFAAATITPISVIRRKHRGRTRQRSKLERIYSRSTDLSPSSVLVREPSCSEPERLRGPQHDRAWADELASWRYPEAWDMLMFGLRLGTNPQVVAILREGTAETEPEAITTWLKSIGIAIEHLGLVAGLLSPTKMGQKRHKRRGRAPRKGTDSSQTLRWSKGDSNSPSHTERERSEEAPHGTAHRSRFRSRALLRSAIVLRGFRPGTGRGENRDRRTEPATGKTDTGKTWTEFAPDSALRKPDRTVGPQSR
jgi:hypothetical protein